MKAQSFGWRAAALAQRYGMELVGDDVEITGPPTPLEKAGVDDWTFLLQVPYRGPHKHVRVLITPEVVETVQARAYLVTSHPRRIMAELLKPFVREPYLPEGVHPQAWVDPTATLEEGVRVGPGAWIGPRVHVGRNTWIGPGVFIGDDTRIGEYCRIYPGVKIYPATYIGNRVILHANAVIGSDGFGYNLDADLPQKIPQIGRVVIEDEVEIGAGTTIDRATLGETRIGKGAKIDNLVQIAHNVHIGEGTIIAAQTGIAGSSQIGQRVILAGQVGVADHVRVGDGVIATAATGISKDVPDGSVVSSGLHAMPRQEHLRLQVLYRKLPELWKRLRELEEKVKKL